MFAVPSVPTESLYKFLALGGIITVITSTVLLMTEYQKLAVDNIKLETKAKIYAIKDEANLKEFDCAKAELEALGSRYEPQIANLEKAFTLQEKSNELSHNPPTLFDWEGRKYTIAEGITLLRKSYLDDMRKVDKTATTLKASTIPLEIEKVHISEQTNLLNQNAEYLTLIVYVWGALVLVGLLSSLYGFSRWVKMQNMSDEITALQLRKARKELEAETEPRWASESRFRSRSIQTGFRA